MFSLVSGIKTILGDSFNILLYPLRILYFHGPSLGGYGFLQGDNKETICYRMTNVRSEFWSSSSTTMDECEILIEKKFYAFFIGCVTIMILCIVFSNLYLISIKYYISKPLAAVVERQIESSIKKHQHMIKQ